LSFNYCCDKRNQRQYTNSFNNKIHHSYYLLLALEFLKMHRKSSGQEDRRKGTPLVKCLCLNPVCSQCHINIPFIYIPSLMVEFQ
jgi:hypothetical protein